MRIAILTYFFADNYGAVLQATALQTVLKRDVSENVVFLNYCNEIQKRNNALTQYGSMRAWCYNFVRLPFYRKRKKRIEKFAQYRKIYLAIDEKPVSDDSIFVEAGRFDLIVVGSDQVWNPNTPDFSKIYFTVLGAAAHICTYGVSIGDCSLEQLQTYAKYIKCLPQILVREESASEKLRSIGYVKPINTVLDPVLLFSGEEWEAILRLNRKERKKKYILCYFLRRRHAYAYWSAAKKLARALGYEIICVNVNAGLFAYTHKTIMDAGPIEFLELISQASLVLTNSFHGTAFSILFHIPFYSLYLSRGNDRRISDVLRMLNLEDRLVSADRLAENIELSDIDYSVVDATLNKKRKEAVDYLKGWRELYDNRS